MLFSDGVAIEEALESLSITEIIESSPNTPFGRSDKRNLAHLLETVASLTGEEQALIRCCAFAKKHRRSKSSLDQSLKSLTKAEIISATPTTSFTRSQKRSRSNLLDVVTSLSSAQQDLILSVACEKSNEISNGPSSSK